MEDNVQKVFSVLIAVIIFFLLPLYMAYEKKDDIAYALALKVTTNFVDNVKSKGYMSRDMYTKFVKELTATDNIYDISLEHISKKYYPVIYAYDAKGKIINKYDYNMYKTNFENGEIAGNRNLSLEYDLATERHDTNQILEICDRNAEAIDFAEYSELTNEKYMSIPETSIPAAVNMYVIKEILDGKTKKTCAYTMNSGDEFNVIIKNKNTTVATTLFNVFTMGANASNNIKVYINYGATIQNEDYR